MGVGLDMRRLLLVEISSERLLVFVELAQLGRFRGSMSIQEYPYEIHDDNKQIWRRWLAFWRRFLGSRWVDIGVSRPGLLSVSMAGTPT